MATTYSRPATGPLLAAGLLLASALTSCGDRTLTSEKPNVLLISIDTLRSDHLGCYGYERDTSPFIDQLAGHGLRYGNAVVNTHGTTPSHTTILTSLFQETHRVSYQGGARNPVPEEATLLQEIYKNHGYRTLGVTGGGNASGKFGFSRGFDVFHDRSRTIAAGTRRLARLISEHQGQGKPIFAFYHTYQVHSPYFPPKEYKALYGDFASDYVPSSENLAKHAHTVEKDLTQADIDHVVAMYDAGIHYTDDKLREFFGKLESMGFFSNAIVVLTSDHGEEFGEHGGLLHRDLLYDELLRVPLIFSGNGVPAGIQQNTMASSVDIAPTLLANSFIPIPPQMQGQPLFSPNGISTDARRHVVSQYGSGRYSVRTARWKYIESLDSLDTELYNLAEDPAEKNDLSSERPEMIRDFHKTLVGWRRSQEGLGGDGSQSSVVLGEDETRQLKALGYLGDS